MTNDIHSWVEERLSAYVDNQLASAERTRLEAHLRDCARCLTSLKSLQWTISLVKQAPAPVLPRQFTIPVSPTPARTPKFSFGFFGAATAMAAVLFFVVASLELYSQFNAGGAGAPQPAPQFAAPAAAPAPTQNIALAPQPAAPTSAPAAPQPTAQPAATVAAPVQLLQPTTAPTIARPQVGTAAETQATPAQADSTAKSSAPTASAPQPLAPRTFTTITGVPSPTRTNAPTIAPPTTTSTLAPTSTTAPTATSAATPTTQLQARAEPTRTLARDTQPAPTNISIWRIIEIGLLALVVILGGLTFYAWRRK